MSWSIMTPSSYIVLHFANPVSSLLNLAAMSVTSWSSVGQALRHVNNCTAKCVDVLWLNVR